MITRLEIYNAPFYVAIPSTLAHLSNTVQLQKRNLRARDQYFRATGETMAERAMFNIEGLETI